MDLQADGKVFVQTDAQIAFALRLLHEEKVAVVPGSAFGECGEGHIRCAYATSLDNIREALTRLRRFMGRLAQPPV